MLTNAAENSNMVKKKINYSANLNKNIKHQKPWFNNESKLKRKEYITAKRKYRQLNSTENYEKLVVSSRTYKKLINKQIREYNGKLTNKLKLLKNSDPKSYWSILNRYSSEGKKALQKTFTIESFHEHFSKLNEATPGNDFEDR